MTTPTPTGYLLPGGDWIAEPDTGPTAEFVLPGSDWIDQGPTAPASNAIYVWEWL